MESTKLGDDFTRQTSDFPKGYDDHCHLSRLRVPVHVRDCVNAIHVPVTHYNHAPTSPPVALPHTPIGFPVEPLV